MKRLFGALALACACLTSLPAGAELPDKGRLFVIQQRKFRLGHEIELGGTFEPQDAFSKGIAGEAAYTLHFGDEWGWEILRAGYLVQFDTGLRTQLRRDFGVVPTQFETLQYYASSAAVWSPSYGKMAWRNASILHVEMFLTAGVAAGRFSSSYGFGPELGVGARLFLTSLLSWRLEVRDAYFLQRNPQNVVFLSTGLSFNFGGPD